MKQKILNVIFDSNIYGILILDKNKEELIEKIVLDPRFIVHKFIIIRKELRETPKKVRSANGKSIRVALLETYDKITKGKIIGETANVENLAKEYYKQYRRYGGAKRWDKIKNDFKIVSCATISNFDLIVSEDNHSMKSNTALKAYRISNIKHNYRTPTFYTYTELKRRYLSS